MKACLSGVFGILPAGNTLTYDVVVPEGCAPLSANERPSHIPLLHYELNFTRGPLAMASYPAIALRLAKADPAILKKGLALTLAGHPMMAGRIRGCTVALTNEGVPFCVVDCPEESAPEEVEESQLLRFADFRRGGRVQRGLEPLVTVRLTRFRDGSAILCMCRSHALFDGSSAWACLNHWARAARGEASAPLNWSRQALMDAVPTEERLNEIAVKKLGRPLKHDFLSYIAPVLFPLIREPYDLAFLMGVTGDLTRTRIFFSDEEMARIKTAATPVPGSGGDGWVSTQEAMCAYILHTLARATLPETSRGRASLLCLLDARKALGLKPDQCIGAGLVLLRVDVANVLKMLLSEVGGAVHERAKTALSQEAVADQWRLMAGASEQGKELDAMFAEVPQAKEYDICLYLNNQSKRELPNFGAAGSGGVAQAVVTNAGPTLMLPAPGGVNLFLDRSTLSSARSPAARAAAIAALREQLPEAVADEESCPAAAGGA